MHIQKVMKSLNLPLAMYGVTPALGDCWYQAVLSLMEELGFERMTVEEHRNKIVDNIEMCPNFDNVNEIVFKNDPSKLKIFKQRHKQRGTFTDDYGIMVLATSYVLDITINIISQTNTKDTPYTTYNQGKHISLYIFHDTRIENSEHFQSLHKTAPSVRKSTRIDVNTDDKVVEIEKMNNPMKGGRMKMYQMVGKQQYESLDNNKSDEKVNKDKKRKRKLSETEEICEEEWNGDFRPPKNLSLIHI